MVIGIVAILGSIRNSRECSGGSGSISRSSCNNRSISTRIRNNNAGRRNGGGDNHVH